jgi:hypothetical protein
MTGSVSPVTVVVIFYYSSLRFYWLLTFFTEDGAKIAIQRIHPPSQFGIDTSRRCMCVDVHWDRENILLIIQKEIKPICSMLSARRSSSNATGRPDAFYMHPLDLPLPARDGGYFRGTSSTTSIYGHSYAASATAASSTDAANEGLARRRSHRPRGCRGGRKNRKNLNGATSPSSSSSSLHGPNSSSNKDNIFQSKEPLRYSHLKAKGEDLSPYQHVKTLKVWDFNAQHNDDAVPGTATGQGGNSMQKPLMMLPPPVPSALFEVRQFCLDHSGSGLKMLPSFEESDSASESLMIPPPLDDSNRHSMPSQHCYSAILPLSLGNHFRNDEATVDTVDSIGSSSDDSDTLSSSGWGPTTTRCTASTFRPQLVQKLEIPAAEAPISNHEPPQVYESGSLFVTSPRSFLLGEGVQNHSKIHPLPSSCNNATTTSFSDLMSRAAASSLSANNHGNALRSALYSHRVQDEKSHTSGSAMPAPLVW